MKWMIGVAALAATTFGAALLLPGKMYVERTAVVRGTPDQVQSQIAELTHRPEWVVWTQVDPGARYTFTGEPGSQGSTMSWVGEEIGSATLTLVEARPGEVVSRLDYEAPFAMTSVDRFRIRDNGDGTSQVTWSAEAELSFGPQRVFGLFADGMLGPEYEAGLIRLDALVASL